MGGPGVGLAAHARVSVSPFRRVETIAVAFDIAVADQSGQPEAQHHHQDARYGGCDTPRYRRQSQSEHLLAGVVS